MLSSAAHEERVACILQVRESTISRTLVILGKVDNQGTQGKPWSSSEGPEGRQGVEKWMLRDEIISLASTEAQQQRNNLHLSSVFP